MNKKVLQVNKIHKRYGDLLALNYLSLDVYQGEIFGLLGPNGSGKSTLLHCVLGLLDCESGQVKIFDQELKANSYNLKSRIGFVMQEIGVYNELSVEENIDYFCSLYINDKSKRNDLVNRAISFVELDEFRKFRPNNLSGGLLRRLNLACGIVHEPDLIILDEPTVAVDPQSRNKILEGILSLKEAGKTIIYTSHYMEEIERIADRVAIIDKGELIALGSIDEIKSSTSIGESIQVQVSNLTDQAKTSLDSLPGCLQTHYFNGLVTLHFASGPSYLQEVLDILKEAGISILSVQVQKPTLNDVFLEITGKELRDHA